MKYCTDCGTKIENGNNYCVGCGKSLKKEKGNYCTNCGNKLNPRNGICMHCVMERKKLSNKVEQPKVDPEIKKFDLLIKIGVLMVLIAGFVLATTTLNFLPNIFVFIAFLGLSGLFYGLYKFCEKKLKIKSSTVLYFVTSLLFILIAFISAFHFAIFGKWLSFHGGGRYLSISLLFLYTSVLFYICKKKYKNSIFLSISLISFVFSVLFLLYFLGLGWLTNLAVISFAIVILYLYLKNKSVSLVIIGLVKVFIDGLLVLIIRPEYSILSGTMLTVCDGFLLYIFGYTEKNNIIKVFSAIILYVFFTLFLIYSLSNSLFVVSFICGVLFLLFIMIVIINIINEKSDLINWFCRVSRIMCLSIISCIIIYLIFNYFVMFFSNLYIDETKYYINFFISSLILLLANLLIIRDYTIIKNKIYSYFIIPEIVLSLFTLYKLISIYINGLSIIILFLLLSIILYVYYLCTNNKIFKFIAYISCLVLLSISYLGMGIVGSVRIESILGISYLIIPVFSLIIYLHEKSYEKRKTFKWISIIIYTLSVILLSSYDICAFGSTLSLAIGFVILLLTILMNFDDNICMYLLPFASICLLEMIFEEILISSNLSLMILSTYSILVSLLFASRFRNKTYNILTIIAFSLILLIVFASINDILAIYIAVVAIISILFDLYSKKIKGLYIVGIIYLGLAVLYEITKYFKNIPFWIYLLIGGLAIIIFASIKLAKKVKND